MRGDFYVHKETGLCCFVLYGFGCDQFYAVRLMDLVAGDNLPLSRRTL